jgi:hypothetical protein
MSHEALQHVSYNEWDGIRGGFEERKGEHTDKTNEMLYGYIFKIGR